MVTKLHSILKPFLLRRVKTDVESALPGKLEVVLYAPMTPTQRKLNDQLLKTTLRVGAGGRAAVSVYLKPVYTPVQQHSARPTTQEWLCGCRTRTSTSRAAPARACHASTTC